MRQHLTLRSQMYSLLIIVAVALLIVMSVVVVIKRQSSRNVPEPTTLPTHNDYPDLMN